MVRKHVVVLGGGTGNFTVLTGLMRHRDNVELSAIVSVADDGGSTGILRDEYGVLPPGDICQCLIAMAECSEELRAVFNYRFTEGSLNGHRFGNLFLTAFQKSMVNPLKAIEAMHAVLAVGGRVIPVSERQARLCAELRNGEVVNGEHSIDILTKNRSPIRRCLFETRIPANPGALEAIQSADMIVLAPGDLYTSLVPVLLVDGIPEALRKTKAEIVQVVNLTCKEGQTDGFGASRFCTEIEIYLNPAKISIALINSAKPSTAITQRYADAGNQITQNDFLTNPPFRVIHADLIADEIAERIPGDKLTRSLLRHDPDKLAHALLNILLN
ncbi:YvcK family protein [Candidatus Uhrbacteria bacterium]|nr:YvcK family protein [Candidatus Uhrbacteria bacterium]